MKTLSAKELKFIKSVIEQCIEYSQFEPLDKLTLSNMQFYIESNIRNGLLRIDLFVKMEADYVRNSVIFKIVDIDGNVIMDSEVESGTKA